MLEQLMNGAVTVEDGNVSVTDEAGVASDQMDALVHTAVRRPGRKRQRALADLGDWPGCRRDTIVDT